MSSNLSITVPFEITLERISDLLCSALEGGTGYWAMIGDYVEPTAIWHGKGEGDTFPHIDYPLSPGGAITVWEQLEEINPDAEPVFDEDGDEDETANMPAHRLDLPVIMRGLEAMARVAPRHFADFLGEGGDAITGDVFLQCCLFGDTKYG